MGRGATNTLDRVAASLGLKGTVGIVFEACQDVPNGGVLLALPALLANGLLDHTDDHFTLPEGYYGLESLFLLLGFMALARLKYIEDLRYCAPGEWGKLLGLDRVPEVKTLRHKIQLLSEKGKPENWSAQLCEQWMQANPEQAAVLCVDGHVRVYNGHLTKLPRHYVSRQKLCLRATVDYWVNALDGQPFFMINKAVDPGLIQVLEQDIVPRLLKQVPHQPTQGALEANKNLPRLTFVFDREGYSPAFLLSLKKKRIACHTYHKHPGEDWPQEEFSSHQTPLAHGQQTHLMLAERGTCLSNKLWVRAIRKLTKRGHQTALISTDYHSDLIPIATEMFSRGSQENFFKYMRKNFNIDALVNYSVEPIPDTIRVVNPLYRQLDNQVRSKTGILSRRHAKFSAMSIFGEIVPEKMDAFEKNKAALREEIMQLEEELKALKARRKETLHHITVAELPEEERFKRLSTSSKHFVDTIKMIAYRAETAMAQILCDHLSHQDEARWLLQALYKTEANLLPDLEQGTLTIRLHHLANASEDLAVSKLCRELNATETTFPGTKLRLVYEMISS